MIQPRFSIGPSEDAKAIREEVFIKEQGFVNEFDDLDPTSISMVLYDGSLPIATARLVKIDPATYQLGRLAVIKPYRGHGVGHYTVAFLKVKAREMGALTLLAHAQLDKQGFYAKCGFVPLDGVIDEDEGCPHIYMIAKLHKKTQKRRKP